MNNLMKMLKNENKNIEKDISAKKFNINYHFDEEGKKTMPKRKILVTAISIIAVIAIALTVTTLALPKNATNDKNFYMSFDINPSIELNGENGVITSIKGLNSDGVFLAKAVSTLIVGKTPQEATTIIMDKAVSLGYITDQLKNGVINVNVLSQDDKLEEKIFVEISNQTKQYLIDHEITGDVSTSCNNANEEIKNLAKKYDVTVGRMSLIVNAIEKNPNYTIEDLVKLSPNEITKLVKNYDDAKLEKYEKELDALENEFEAQLDAYEVEMKGQLNEFEGQVRTLTTQLKNAKTEQEVADILAKLNELNTKFDKFDLKLDNINLNNVKNVDKNFEKQFEQFEDDLDKELDKLEDDFEKELKQKAKDTLKGYDDDDDTDDDIDDIDDDKDDKDDDKDDKNDKDDDDDDDDVKTGATTSPSPNASPNVTSGATPDVTTGATTEN